MSDTVVGIDHHRKWMLQMIMCDCLSRARSDFMEFFNTRAEAETRLEQIVSCKTNQNIIVKIVKIRAFKHLGSDFEQIEKER